MSENIQVLTDDSFNKTLSENSLPILVDFWAPWCGPCRAVSPVLEELSQEMSSQLAFAKLNIDENGLTPTRFKVKSIPCLIVFRQGEEIGRILGHKGKQILKDELEKIL
ncbi:MAG: thioredoxin [Deltaproteobacteria bacterium]|jgi:thioredoxin 1|nr:thioredoxin [Deltaproteobacteria bacterium]